MGEGATGGLNELDRQNRDVEVLRELYSHWGRGDFGYSKAFAEDYVWKPVDAIESGEYRGFTEVREAWRTWLQAWDGFSIEAEEVIPGSGGRYVVMQLFRGRGKASGLESEERSALVVTMRDGLIARMEGFWDIDAALGHAGVES
jgi:ketosteroid isomerase-like protein